MLKAFMVSIAFVGAGISGFEYAYAQAAASGSQVEAQAAQAFVKKLSDEAFAVLRESGSNQAQREAKFSALLRQGFALDKVAAAVLGKNRRTATPAQLAAFNKAFPDFVLRIYVGRLVEFADTKLAIVGSFPVGTKGDVFVRSLISGKSLQRPVRADWRVTKVPGVGLRIVDLAFEGISQVATQRDEFDAKIAQKGLDSLIADIQSDSPDATVPAARGKQ